jgi:hypothetical protein
MSLLLGVGHAAPAAIWGGTHDEMISLDLTSDRLVGGKRIIPLCRERDDERRGSCRRR